MSVNPEALLALERITWFMSNVLPPVIVIVVVIVVWRAMRRGGLAPAPDGTK